ncbi:MAG: hypothetical protein ABL912_12155 [Novosphingobium sp.]
MLNALWLILAAQAGTSTVAEVQLAEPNPSAMTSKEIHEFNAKVARNHPHFIRCVRTADTGSLVARKSTCRTNRDWAAREANDRDQIRGIGDDLTTRSASSSSN